MAEDEWEDEDDGGVLGRGAGLGRAWAPARPGPDQAMDWVVGEGGAGRPGPGTHKLRVGASSRDARLRGTVDV